MIFQGIQVLGFNCIHIILPYQADLKNTGSIVNIEGVKLSATASNSKFYSIMHSQLHV